MTAPGDLDKVCKACLLAPVSSPAEAEFLRSMAATAVRKAGPGDRFFAWFLMCLGLAEYRAGNWDAALDALGKCRAKAIDPQPIISAAYLQAMTLGRLGQPESAEARLIEARRMLVQVLPADDAVVVPRSWPDWLICRILGREAEVVVRLDSVFPADPLAP